MARFLNWVIGKIPAMKGVWLFVLEKPHFVSIIKQHILGNSKRKQKIFIKQSASIKRNLLFSSWFWSIWKTAHWLNSDIWPPGCVIFGRIESELELTSKAAEPSDFNIKIHFNSCYFYNLTLQENVVWKIM